MKERQIDILDLMWNILSKWRVLIVSMLLGGILLAVFSYVSSYQEVKIQKETVQEKDVTVIKEELENVMTESDINSVLNAVKYEQRYNSYLIYQEETFALSVDPFHVIRADIVFKIEADDMEQAYNIQKMYGSIIESSDLYNYLEENCSLDYSASQLISVDKAFYNEMNGRDTLKVGIVYSDEETCQEIVSKIIDYITMKQEELVEILGEHKVDVIMQSDMAVTDGEYFTLQADYEHELVAFSNTITELKESFTEEQKEYYNCIVENDEEVSISEEIDATPKKPSVNLKSVVIGMLLIGFICVCYIAVKYILNNKLRSNESLTDLYDVHQLGLIPLEQKKKGKLAFIDSWINSLKNRNNRRFTRQEAICMTTAAIKIALRKSSENAVFLVGCDIEKQTKDVCEQVKNILSKEGIVVHILDNILYDAESMTKLENAHSVVLVERANSTLYNEVEKEIEVLKRQNIVILGGVVVE